MLESEYIQILVSKLANAYTSLIVAEEGLTPERFRFKRPTFVDWSSMNLNVLPSLGQTLRMREVIRVEVMYKTQSPSCNVWLNRFTPVSYLGHYQVSNVTAGQGTFLKDSGEMLGSQVVGTTNTWIFDYYYDWSLTFLRRSDDINAASPGVVYNCNADLAPGAVPNRYINNANVEAFASLFYGNPSETIANIIQRLKASFPKPISGYRFPNTTLFTTLQRLPSIDLSGASFATAIGDLYIWLHPDFELVRCYYSVQLREYAVLDKTIGQLPTPQCNYPTGQDFENIDTCSEQFDVFLNGNGSPRGYRTSAELEALINKPEGLHSHVESREWICPSNSNNVYTYYIGVIDEIGG